MKMRGWIPGFILISASLALGQTISDLNLTFLNPAENSWGSMVLGNGDISVNAWVEKGDLCFYIGKNDSRDSYDRMLKVGKVRLRFEPNILAGSGYTETFELDKASWQVRTAQGQVRMWVDANHPCVVIQASTRVPMTITAASEVWRRALKPIPGELLYDPNLRDDPKAKNIPVFEEPDDLVKGLTDRVIWYHRNRNTDLFDKTMALYGIGKDEIPDPLKNRTFGGLISGSAFKSIDESSLTSAHATAEQTLHVVVHTQQTPAEADWVASIQKLWEKIKPESAASLYDRHCAWWKEFWDRSYIYLSSDDPAQSETLSRLTRAYQYQRYVNAVAGRGEYPIKFNGSTIVLDTYGHELSGLKNLSADFRRWGGGLWWQNTRLPYWNMFESGDFDMIDRMLRFYAGLLPAAKRMTDYFFGHEGTVLQEYTLSWGVVAGGIYGWDRTGLPREKFINDYVGDHWVGNWELLGLMLDHYDYTGDERLAADVLRPFALEILKFYKVHFRTDERGKMVIYPSRALETYSDCVNGLPEVAGLRFVLPRLLRLPDRVLPEGELRRLVRDLLKAMPEIPLYVENGTTIIAPAEKVKGRMINVEQPELYAVYPFRLCTLFTKDLDLGRATFLTPSTYGFKPSGGSLASLKLPGGVRDIFGWQQTGIQAAHLGLADSTAEVLVRSALANDARFRFPVYYGPNYDYTPDQDHASVMMKTLQSMIIQSEDERILLLPAFPKDWNVKFKLHGTKKTIVEAEFSKGRPRSLSVTPPSRAPSVAVYNDKRRLV
jgi:hypothetical protein